LMMRICTAPQSRCRNRAPIAHNREQSGHCRVGVGEGPFQWTIVGG
jgi:hypothetical protein